MRGHFLQLSADVIEDIPMADAGGRKGDRVLGKPVEVARSNFEHLADAFDFFVSRQAGTKMKGKSPEIFIRKGISCNAGKKDIIDRNDKGTLGQSALVSGNPSAQAFHAHSFNAAQGFCERR